MEKTPQGTPVGVDDPYAVVGRCDHLTDDGRCRFAAERAEQDPEFARKRRAEDLRCPVVTPEGEPEGETETDVEAPVRAGEDTGESLPGEWDWRDCPQFRARQRSRECVRCGLEERRLAGADERPLLEEHHLQYAEGADADGTDAEAVGHEITVYLCRWCHAKVHDSWARIDDDVGPDPEAIAAAERRRSKEQSELSFETAAERYDE